jgi:hypothetical protein
VIAWLRTAIDQRRSSNAWPGGDLLLAIVERIAEIGDHRIELLGDRLRERRDQIAGIEELARLDQLADRVRARSAPCA